MQELDPSAGSSPTIHNDNSCKRTIGTIDPDYLTSPDTKKLKSLKEKGNEELTERVVKVIEKEFSSEIANCENQIEDIDNKILKTQQFLHSLRYFGALQYYAFDKVKGKQLKKTSPKKLLQLNHPTVRKNGQNPPSYVENSVTDELLSSFNSEVQTATKTALPGSSTSSEINSTLSNFPCIPNLPESKEVIAQGRQGRLQTKLRIVVGNTYQYLPNSSDYNQELKFKWRIYVRGAPDAPNLSELLESVTFTLDKSYSPHDVITIREHPFSLSRRGWGEFKVKLELCFADERNKPVQLLHYLKLSRTDDPLSLTGIWRLGEETWYDVWLYREKELNEENTKESEPLKDHTTSLIESLSVSGIITQTTFKDDFGNTTLSHNPIKSEPSEEIKAKLPSTNQPPQPNNANSIKTVIKVKDLLKTVPTLSGGCSSAATIVNGCASTQPSILAASTTAGNKSHVLSSGNNNNNSATSDDNEKKILIRQANGKLVYKTVCKEVYDMAIQLSEKLNNKGSKTTSCPDGSASDPSQLMSKLSPPLVAQLKALLVSQANNNSKEATSSVQKVTIPTPLSTRSKEIPIKTINNIVTSVKIPSTNRVPPNTEVVKSIMPLKPVPPLTPPSSCSEKGNDSPKLVPSLPGVSSKTPTRTFVLKTKGGPQPPKKPITVRTNIVPFRPSSDGGGGSSAPSPLTLTTKTIRPTQFFKSIEGKKFVLKPGSPIGATKPPAKNLTLSVNNNMTKVVSVPNGKKIIYKMPPTATNMKVISKIPNHTINMSLSPSTRNTTSNHLQLKTNTFTLNNTNKSGSQSIGDLSVRKVFFSKAVVPSPKKDPLFVNLKCRTKDKFKSKATFRKIIDLTGPDEYDLVQRFKEKVKLVCTSCAKLKSCEEVMRFCMKKMPLYGYEGLFEEFSLVFCVSTREKFNSLPLGRQRAIEFWRAREILRTIRNLKLDGAQQLNARKIVQWSQKHGFSGSTKLTSKAALMKTDREVRIPGWRSLSATEIVTSPVKGNQSEDVIIDIESIDLPAVKKEIKVEETIVADLSKTDSSSFLTTPDMIDSCYFLDQNLSKLRIKLPPEEATAGVKMNLAKNVLWKATLSFMEDLLRCSSAAALEETQISKKERLSEWEKWTQRLKNPSHNGVLESESEKFEIESKHVVMALRRGRPEFELFSGQSLGKESIKKEI